MIDLRAERLNRGFSVRGLAREIGVPEQSIRRAELGQGVTPANAYKMATFFQLRVTDIWPVQDRERHAAV